MTAQLETPMTADPRTISLHELPDILASHFQHKKEITCYVGSNAATPTASLEAIVAAVKQQAPRLPFLKMVHLLLQGPVPHVEPGLQDRIMTYSIFSAGQVRKAANEGRAFYLPCTLANIDSLIGKGKLYQPDLAIFKIRPHEVTREYSLGLSVEAMHTAIGMPAPGAAGMGRAIEHGSGSKYSTRRGAVKASR